MIRRRTPRRALVNARTLSLSPPVDDDDLHEYIYLHFGLDLVRSSVCEGHCAQFDPLRFAYFHDPMIMLLHACRSGGKSMMDMLLIHIKCKHNNRFGAKILGGSKDQSAQVYRTIEEIILPPDAGLLGGDAAAFARHPMKQSAEYRSGSRVSILAASRNSVRGPHDPLVILDEIDEMDPDLRDAAIGIAQGNIKKGYTSSLIQSSTWHRAAGPMEQQIDKAKEQGDPLFAYCAFDIIERCPDWRSGPDLELCHQCPLMPDCHADMGGYGRGVPKAKRADGYYPIDNLIQKANSVTRRTFESDYLCVGPKLAGVWFGSSFDPSRHVSASVMYDPLLPLYCGIDSGVRTAAVWFQVRQFRPPAYAYGAGRPPARHYCTVLAEYFSEDRGAFHAARDIIESSYARFGRNPDVTWTDPAGDSRTAIGTTVLAEYKKAGMNMSRHAFRHWPQQGRIGKLNLVEAFLSTGGGQISMQVHPDCKGLIAGFQNFMRAKVHGSYQDYPPDIEQHPHEDYIDALAGPLQSLFPAGLDVESGLYEVSSSLI